MERDIFLTKLVIGNMLYQCVIDNMGYGECVIDNNRYNISDCRYAQKHKHNKTECSCWIEYLDQKNIINFSTWDGFGKLVTYMNNKYQSWMMNNITLAILDPEIFATQVYNYLQNTEQQYDMEIE